MWDTPVLAVSSHFRHRHIQPVCKDTVETGLLVLAVLHTGYDINMD